MSFSGGKVRAQQCCQHLDKMAAGVVMQAQMMLRASWCKKEPGPGFGQEVLCQESYYVAAFVVCRHISDGYQVELCGRGSLLGGETTQILPLLGEACPF